VTHALYSYNFALEGAIFALEAPYLLFALLLMKMSPVLAMGQMTKDSMWASPNVPTVQGVAPVLAPGKSRMPEMELVLEPDSLASADTALPPAPMTMA